MQLQQGDLLRGLHLLVTRPLEQAHDWSRQLRKLGAMVTIQPMLTIEPLTDKESTVRIVNIMRRFDEFQKVVFISQNAVKYGIEWLNKYWPQIPFAVEFFAIGASTAVSLEARGIQVQSTSLAIANDSHILQM